jgi:hypothetical protein
MREYMRIKREERKEKGLCVTCGSRPHVPGRVSCEVCLTRNRTLRAERERKGGLDYEDIKKLRG